MDRSYVYSLVGHAVVFGAVFAAAHISARPMKPPMNIYHVQAVSSSSIASLVQRNNPRPTPPRRAVPQVQTKTKTLPQENRKESQAAQQTAPSPPAEAATPAVTNTPDAAPGVSGIKTDTEFEYPEYLADLQERIRAQWRPPTSRNDLATRVYFKLNRQGGVLQVFIEQPTANRGFDAAARTAVIAANPFPPLPEEYDHDELGVHFDFIYRAN